jgi:hypothetical protein
VPLKSVAGFPVTAVPVSLTTLESVCFEQVSFWVGVVARGQGRCGRLVGGRPYTRLPAAELVANLEERLPFVSLTLRQVRRALNRLVELGLLVREQFWQAERWRSDYWYSLAGAPEAETPVKPEVAETVTPRFPEVRLRGDAAGTPVLKPLSATPTEKTNGRGVGFVRTLEAEPASRVDKGETGARGPCVPLQPLSNPAPLFSVRSTGATPQRAGQAEPGTATRPAGATPLARVVARCLELAGLAAEAPVTTPTPPSRVVAGGLVTELVKVNGCLHRVADPASTAFLR